MVDLANCDTVVMEAMVDYWSSRGGDMHFFRTSVVEKLKKFNGDWTNLSTANIDHCLILIFHTSSILCILIAYDVSEEVPVFFSLF